MSQIKVKGNASGTGVFTIESPATNTDRTLTLPDNAGTVLTSASDLDATKITGDLPAISGASITNLNASNLASGTVATARLGSGTANNTTYLRGDQTWATVSTTPTTAQVLSATAGLTAGDIGSYAMMKSDNTSPMSPGSTRAGSALYWANTGSGRFGTTRPSGTWRVLGNLFYDTNGDAAGGDGLSTSLFLRIS